MTLLTFTMTTYRKNNQHKSVRKSMEEIEFTENTFTEVQEQIEDYLETRKYAESKSTPTK